MENAKGRDNSKKRNWRMKERENRQLGQLKEGTNEKI